MTFQLPPDVSCQKRMLSFGIAYVFRHNKIGELGRIVLQELPDGLTHTECEVVGDRNDPMTRTREMIFKPLALEIMEKLNTAMGQSIDTQPQRVTRPPEPKHCLKSTLMQCDICKENVALLIFADSAQDLGGLEDYARLMYSEVQRLNVPTWVIGAPSGRGNPLEQKSMILKIFPQREPVFLSSPNEFNPIIDKLIDSHCV